VIPAHPQRLRHARLLAAVLLAPLVLAACSSSAPAPKRTGGATGGTSAGLARKLSAALDTIPSAHLNIDAGSLGGTSTADVQLAHGEATATDVHVTQSGQDVEVVTVGGTSYAKVPGGTKPWAVVSPTSSNPTAKALATNTGVSDVLTSLSVLVGLVRSSHDVQELGTDATGTHYRFQLDPRKSTGNPKLDSMMQALGSQQVPVDLWVDKQNRPLKVVLHIALGGAQFPISVLVSKFGEPLAIQAPPAADVSS
jgi:hypothetical protein